ncbi:MAG TPA: tetratricopeptide repeat protein [Gammaproteobacteria bacterium]|nr:tetratricopeptide repeat protein [Gammaproteobacteria bacterium]
MRNKALLAIFVLVVAGPLWEPRPAHADSPAFSDGTRAYASGDYRKALAYFQQARSAGIDGPAIHYNLAVCNYRLRSYPEAESEFRLIAERYPAMRALADYNIGLVLLAEHREAEAREQFDLASKTSADDKITRLADTMLRRMDSSAEPAKRGESWVSLVDVNVGHDDNVALLDDSSLPPGRSSDSAFSELLAVVSGPISRGPGLRFDGSLYAVDYADASDFNQTAARAGGAYRWSAGAWGMEAEIHFSDSMLDGNDFEHRLGAGLTLRRPLSKATVFGLSLMHEEVGSGESQYAFLRGSREQLGVTWDRYGANARLTLAYRYESNDRDSPAVSPTRNGVSLRYRYTMSPDWTADLSLGLRSSTFDNASIPRDEDRYDFSAAVRRRFARTWHVNGTYLWSDNRSDVAAFAYTRQRLSLGVTKDF